LVGKFVDGISPLFEMPDFRLVIKLHPRENISEFQKMINTRPTSEKIRLIGKSPLNPLFVLSKGAVVLASTVGLEALMMGIPLGVLEIPGTGFVYDYVERGAAIGLTWDKSIVDQVCEMLTRNHCDKQAVEDYIKYSLTTLHNAAETVVELINQTVRN
jgi:hypothetical protein